MLSQMVQDPSRRDHAGNGLEMTWTKRHFTLDVQVLEDAPRLAAGVGVIDQCKSPGHMVKPCKRRGRVCAPKLTQSVIDLPHPIRFIFRLSGSVADYIQQKPNRDANGTLAFKLVAPSLQDLSQDCFSQGTLSNTLQECDKQVQHRQGVRIASADHVSEVLHSAMHQYVCSLPE